MGKRRDFRESRRDDFDFDDDDRPRRFDRQRGGPRGAGFPPPRNAYVGAYVGAPPASPDQPAMRATVKWFNAEKGFGFVALDGGSDAFLHVRTLQRTGRDTLAPGTTLSIRTQPGLKGIQVSEVLEIDDSTAVAERPARGERPFGRPREDRGEPRIASSVGVTGTVKWYNAQKGFGFIAAEGLARDVFVHASALQRAGLSQLAEGQPVVIDIAEGRKGPEAIAIRPAG
ncbi:MAG TPA: cold-shock protein [Alphaproteobacteria bacterium]